MMNLRFVAMAPVVAVLAACSAAPDDSSSSSAIAQATIVSRGMEWVNAGLHYCQAAHGAVDDDKSCWAWEGSSHKCERESNSAWNAYRSDCSGFVSYSWGLPPVGTGGYTTGDFAPFGNSFSHSIEGSALEPGDALNRKAGDHIVLFKKWITQGKTAEFMEEPGCSSSEPYAHSFTSNVSISGSQVTIDYENSDVFYAIRFNGSVTNGGGGGGGGGNNIASADACSKGDGFCTETLQCDNGHWIVRQDDAQSCTTIENVEESCSVGGGYCTETLQCENGHWVPRAGDPAACTSGPGAD